MTARPALIYVARWTMLRRALLALVGGIPARKRSVAALQRHLEAEIGLPIPLSTLWDNLEAMADDGLVRRSEVGRIGRGVQRVQIFHLTVRGRAALRDLRRLERAVDARGTR